MKILIITNMYPSGKNPNYGVFVKNIANGLIDKGAEIDLIYLQKERNKLKKLVNYILFYIKIVVAYIFGDFDIVYGHFVSHISIPILVGQKFSPKKLVINIHGGDIKPLNKTGKKLQRLVGKVLERCDGVIVPSYYSKEIVAKQYHVSKDKIIISPSGGIDGNIFYKIIDNKKLINKYKIDATNKVVGYVGRLDPGKDWKIVIQVANELIKNLGMKDIKFIIVGDGKEKVELLNMVEKYNLNENIIYMGMLKQEMLNEIYNILDILLFPTAGESLGLVAIEAMASGTPVIGSNNSSLPEFIKNGKTGYLVDENTKAEFSMKVIQLLDEINIGKSFMDKCILMSKKYNKEDVIQKLYENFKSI